MISKPTIQEQKDKANEMMRLAKAELEKQNAYLSRVSYKILYTQTCGEIVENMNQVEHLCDRILNKHHTINKAKGKMKKKIPLIEETLETYYSEIFNEFPYIIEEIKTLQDIRDIFGHSMMHIPENIETIKRNELKYLFIKKVGKNGTEIIKKLKYPLEFHTVNILKFHSLYMALDPLI